MANRGPRSAKEKQQSIAVLGDSETHPHKRIRGYKTRDRTSQRVGLAQKGGDSKTRRRLTAKRSRSCNDMDGRKLDADETADIAVWDMLPVEVIHYLLLQSDVRAALGLFFTSRRLHAVCGDERLWRQLFARDFPPCPLDRGCLWRMGQQVEQSGTSAIDFARRQLDRLLDVESADVCMASLGQGPTGWTIDSLLETGTTCDDCLHHWPSVIRARGYRWAYMSNAGHVPDTPHDIQADVAESPCGLVLGRLGAGKQRPTRIVGRVAVGDGFYRGDLWWDAAHEGWTSIGYATVTGRSKAKHFHALPGHTVLCVSGDLNVYQGRTLDAVAWYRFNRPPPSRSRGVASAPLDDASLCNTFFCQSSFTLPLGDSRAGAVATTTDVDSTRLEKERTSDADVGIRVTSQAIMAPATGQPYLKINCIDDLALDAFKATMDEFGGMVPPASAQKSGRKRDFVLLGTHFAYAGPIATADGEVSTGIPKQTGSFWHCYRLNEPTVRLNHEYDGVGSRIALLSFDDMLGGGFGGDALLVRAHRGRIAYTGSVRHSSTQMDGCFYDTDGMIAFRGRINAVSREMVGHLYLSDGSVLTSASWHGSSGGSRYLVPCRSAVATYPNGDRIKWAWHSGDSESSQTRTIEWFEVAADHAHRRRPDCLTITSADVGHTKLWKNECMGTTADNVTCRLPNGWHTLCIPSWVTESSAVRSAGVTDAAAVSKVAMDKRKGEARAADLLIGETRFGAYATNLVAHRHSIVDPDIYFWPVPCSPESGKYPQVQDTARFLDAMAASHGRGWARCRGAFAVLYDAPLSPDL